jgi:NADH:ubiquinone oxidoreductase subunit 5 (subunit L)/multisubunit Na+/H+ antiporter MnhA subunit
VSKWYLYQSLFNASLVLKSPVDRGICVGAIGVLACVGALAIACFAKAIGVALLGKGRSHRAHSAHEAPFLMLMPILILVFLCVSLGFATPYVVPHLGLVLHDGMSSSSSILVPQFILPLTAAILIVGIVLYLFILSRRPRIYITWDCGFGALTARAQVAADSFAQPIARIFTPVFRHAVAVEISGKDRRHFPEKVHVEPSMVSLLETQVYAPLGKALHTLSRWLAKFQAGSIHLYLMYVCISLVLLVLLGTYAW